MRLTGITPATVRDLWSACVSGLAESPCIEEVADVVVGRLYEMFPESLVMARAFLTAPFQSLPGRQRAFAAALAESVQCAHLLGPLTPVLSLLATRGCVEAWNDPRSSRTAAETPSLSDAAVFIFSSMRWTTASESVWDLKTWPDFSNRLRISW